jgi:hypothetical protein
MPAFMAKAKLSPMGSRSNRWSGFPSAPVRRTAMS